MALETSQIVTRTVNLQFEIAFDYPEMNKVMRVIKENNLKVVDQIFELDCRVIISVRKKEANRIYEKFDATYKVKITELENY